MSTYCDQPGTNHPIPGTHHHIPHSRHHTCTEQNKRDDIKRKGSVKADVERFPERSIDFFGEVDGLITPVPSQISSHDSSGLEFGYGTNY